MKKIQAFLLSAILLLSFTACNSTSPTMKSSSEAKSSKVNSEPVISEKSAFTDKVFELTIDKYISLLNEGLEENNFTTLSKNKAKIKPSELEGIGKTNYFQFNIADGVSLIIDADKTSNKIISISYRVNTSKITEESTKCYLICLGFTEGYLAGDEAERIDEELNLENIEKDSITIADTERYSFTYIVDKEILNILIMRNSI